MKKVKAVFYGINGTGLGHLSRLLNIAREARILLRAMDIKADFHFITTSEAPQVAWDFPVYKIPSKTVVAPSDTANQTYVANSQFFISNLMALLRPDILVMDTIPQGSFGEFLSMKNFAKKKVFINRHKNDDYAQSDLHQSMLPLYDLIISPGENNGELDYHIPPQLKDKHIFTSPIHSFRTENSWSREKVRDYFGAENEHKLIYVSAGGGGDQAAEAQMKLLIDGALSNPKNLVLAGYGPLYRGKRTYHPKVIPLTEAGISKYFNGLDGAICAAGYNTFHELLAAGVPSSFFAQTKGMDLQEIRIQSGAKNGWNRFLENIDPESVKEEIEILLSKEIQHSIRQNLKKRPEGKGAQKAAFELLKLHKTVQGSAISYPEMYLFSVWRGHWAKLIEEIKSTISQNHDLHHFLPESLRYGLKFLKHLKDKYQYIQAMEKAQMVYLKNDHSTLFPEILTIGIQIADLKFKRDLSNRRMGLLLSQFAKEDIFRQVPVDQLFPHLEEFIHNKITHFPLTIESENTINLDQP